jgi:prevent-host-death family protein
MASVGVRELRQRASALLRRVEQGETIEVTDRGRRVAILAPSPEGSPLERLRLTGEVEPATADLDDLPPATYLDSSAIVKLAVREPESLAVVGAGFTRPEARAPAVRVSPLRDDR